MNMNEVKAIDVVGEEMDSMVDNSVKEKECAKAAESITTHDVILGGDTKTLSVELVKSLPLISNHSASTSLIDDVNVGVDVDHYVVHLSESVDGSEPSIETTFIPAGCGNSLFATDPSSTGIQPIAIIEAAAVSGAGVQVPGGQMQGSILGSMGGSKHIESVAQSSMEATNVLIALSKGTHSTSLLEESAKTNAVSSFLQDSPDKELAIADGSPTQTIIIDRCLLDMESEDRTADCLVKEEDNDIVIKDEQAGADITEVTEAIAMFSGAPDGAGLVRHGQIASSQNQPFLSCPSVLADYTNQT